MEGWALRSTILFFSIVAGVFAQTRASWRELPQKRFVAVVGAGSYGVGTAWQVLQAATNDAAAVAALFHDGLGFDIVDPPLTDPTESALRSWLTGLKQKVEGADELIVFITGHGTSSGQFVSVDARLIPVKEILDSIFQLSVRRLLVIQHFCYSAGRAQATLPAGKAGLVREVMASGRAQVYNRTPESLDYSPFTLGLLKYFSARLTNYTTDRVVTAADLASALAGQEPDLDRKAVLVNARGAGGENFTFDLDGREKNTFRRAVSQPGLQGAALRDYLKRFPHAMYEREAWALIENIERETRESENLERHRGSLKGGEETDVWLNSKDRLKYALKYAWVPATSKIETGREGLRVEDLANDYSGFWMTQTEVPVAAYKERAERMPRAPGFDRNWDEDNGNQPMVNVSLVDARAYCGKAGGRLPTEAEWEYAARAQKTGEYFGQGRELGFANLRGKRCPGSGETCDQYDHYEHAAPVDKLASDVNTWLLFGMTGNVSEIIDTPSDAGNSQQALPTKPVARMWTRGANFADPAGDVFFSIRRPVYAGGANTVGFRCVIPYGR